MKFPIILALAFTLAFILSSQPSLADNQTNATNVTKYPDILLIPQYTSFDINVGESETREIRVLNKGNRTAANVTFDTISFNNHTVVNFYPNNFDVEYNQSVFVNATFYSSEIIPKFTVFSNVTVYYIDKVEVYDNVTNQTFLEELLILDPALQKELQLDLECSLIETEIEINVPVDTFEISVNRSGEGVVIIENLGNSTAENITLSMNSTSFEQNSFDLAAGDRTFIDFSINIPYEFPSNVTHNFTLRAKGANFAEQAHPVSVFVPYALPSVNASEYTFIFAVLNETVLEAFCTTYPDRCPHTTIEKVVYQNKTYSRQFTQEEVEAMEQRNIELEGQLQRTENRLNIIDDSMEDFKGDVQDVLVAIQENTQETANAMIEMKNDIKQDQSESASTANMVMIPIISTLFTGLAYVANLYFRKGKAIRY